MHPTISSSVVPFSRLQSFSASGSFPMSQWPTAGCVKFQLCPVLLKASLHQGAAFIVPTHLEEPWWFPRASCLTPKPSLALAAECHLPPRRAKPRPPGQDPPTLVLALPTMLPDAFPPHLVICCPPCGSGGKESNCNAGDLGLIPGLGRPLGEGKGYPLQYSGLENSMNPIHGVAKSQTRLSVSIDLLTSSI